MFQAIDSWAVHGCSIAMVHPQELAGLARVSPFADKPGQAELLDISQVCHNGFLYVPKQLRRNQPPYLECAVFFCGKPKEEVAALSVKDRAVKFMEVGGEGSDLASVVCS